MADSKDDKAAGPKTADDVRMAGSQPKVDPQKPDTTKASPDAARAAMLASSQPTGDVVGMVSRDKDGNPAQSKNFVVLIPEGATDAERDAHWNRAGELQGAKHLEHSGGVEHTLRADGTWGDLSGFTDEELAEREKTERRELHRHNFREELKD